MLASNARIVPVRITGTLYSRYAAVGGLFQNDGSGLNDDFGDTSDRILYLAALETERMGTFNFGMVADFTFTKQQDPRISGLGGAIQGPSRRS